MLRQFHLPGPAGLIRVANGLRHLSQATRPQLASILPKKKAISRLLFDHDSRLTYSKVLPIFSAVYDNLDKPAEITLPHYTTNEDLMTLRAVLRDIRVLSSAVNKNIVDLENELVEQAAELGNNDAIAMLAFEAIQLPETSKEDYLHATNLVKQLQDIKHPLVFKLAGDLANTKGCAAQAAQYWHEYLELDGDSVVASHVYASLGAHYFNKPSPDLFQAKTNFEKAVKFGELDSATVKAHYFLGQLHATTDPRLARFHLETSASRGLEESFSALGYLELNMFNDPAKALEWFRLGVELKQDMICLIGQFDSHVRTENWAKAASFLRQLHDLHSKLVPHSKSGFAKVPAQFQDQAKVHFALLSTFFDTRKDIIAKVQTAARS